MFCIWKKILNLQKLINLPSEFIRPTLNLALNHRLCERKRSNPVFAPTGIPPLSWPARIGQLPRRLICLADRLTISPTAPASARRSLPQGARGIDVGNNPHPGPLFS